LLQRKQKEQSSNTSRSRYKPSVFSFVYALSVGPVNNKS
jgi:hypothetical protein